MQSQEFNEKNEHWESLKERQRSRKQELDDEFEEMMKEDLDD